MVLDGLILTCVISVACLVIMTQEGLTAQMWCKVYAVELAVKAGRGS